MNSMIKAYEGVCALNCGILETLFSLNNMSVNEMLPFVARDLLLNENESSELQLSVDNIHINDSNFYVIMEENTILNKILGLKGHTTVKPSTEFMKHLRNAIEFLSRYDDAWSTVSGFIRSIVIVEKTQKIDEPLITSCTLPELPSLIVLSEKATRHIPPTTVTDKPSCVLLAENIYHESVHQIVNLGIIFDGFMAENYSSISTNKIDIPWRKNSSNRNRAWEPDRALHAAAVYVKLIAWRKYVLGRDDIDEFVKQAIIDSYESAVYSADYLIQSLLNECNDSLSSNGYKFVEVLQQRLSEIISGN